MTSVPSPLVPPARTLADVTEAELAMLDAQRAQAIAAVVAGGLEAFLLARGRRVQLTAPGVVQDANAYELPAITDAEAQATLTRLRKARQLRHAGPDGRPTKVHGRPAYSTVDATHPPAPAPYSLADYIRAKRHAEDRAARVGDGRANNPTKGRLRAKLAAGDASAIAWELSLAGVLPYSPTTADVLVAVDRALGRAPVS